MNVIRFDSETGDMQIWNDASEGLYPDDSLMWCIVLVEEPNRFPRLIFAKLSSNKRWWLPGPGKQDASIPVERARHWIPAPRQLGRKEAGKNGN